MRMVKPPAIPWRGIQCAVCCFVIMMMTACFVPRPIPPERVGVRKSVSVLSPSPRRVVGVTDDVLEIRGTIVSLSPDSISLKPDAIMRGNGSWLRRVPPLVGFARDSTVSIRTGGFSIGGTLLVIGGAFALYLVMFGAAGGGS